MNDIFQQLTRKPVTSLSTSVQALILICILSFSSFSGENPDLERASEMMESTVSIEAEIFAPESFGKAKKYFDRANSAAEKDKTKNVAENAEKAQEYLENAVKATELAKISLEVYLEPRIKAKAAGAAKIVPGLFQKAEAQLKEAASELESGDLKGALAEAAKSTPFYDTAELSAIKISIMSEADRLIEEALEDEAEKFALVTMNKARSSRILTDALLDKDRYDREAAESEIAVAEYEARHASNIAQTVRSMNRKDQDWEKLILVEEDRLNRVGKLFGIDGLDFRAGSETAVDSLVAMIGRLQGDKAEFIQMNSVLAKQLGLVFSTPGVVSYDDPVVVADKIQKEISRLLEEREVLSGFFGSFQASLARIGLEISGDSLPEVSKSIEEGLSYVFTRTDSLRISLETVSSELETRKEREEKFWKAKTMLRLSEGEVIFNTADEIVLRLVGLSFDTGRSDIRNRHTPLLKKAADIIRMFPDSKISVEGHTDSSGDRATNNKLSRHRAGAVKDNLKQELDLSDEEISATGFGADKPIASNSTSQGRARNRRIDIAIKY